MKTFVESKVTDSKIDAVQGKSGKKQWHGAHKNMETKQIKNCRKCGNSHAIRMCLAFGQTCNECGKPNHYTKMRRLKKKKNKEIDGVDSGSDTESEFEIETVQGTTGQKKWTVTLKVEKSSVKFKIDTGAECNIISKSVCDKLGIKKLQHPKAKLVSYTGHKLQIAGKIQCSVQHKDKYYVLPFYVVPGKVDPILGLLSCEELNILTLVETIGEQKTTETTQTYLKE
jgi:predicted aspartyl protease